MPTESKAPDDRTGPEPALTIERSQHVLVVVHGLLIALGTYILVSGYAVDKNVYSLLTLPALLLPHALLYRLPDRYVTRPEFQHLAIVLTVTATGLWLMLFSTQARIGYLSVIALALLLPLIWQRSNVWLLSTVGILGFILAIRVAGWTDRGAPIRMTEASVLLGAVLVWIVYAFLFDSLKVRGGLSASLSREQEKVRVLACMARGFAAAEDVEGAFSVASNALRNLVGGRRCRLAIVDPIRWTGSVVALEDEVRELPGKPLDLGEQSPLRRILDSDTRVHIDASGMITLPLDTGFGIHVISCEAESRLMDADTRSLLDDLAESTAMTMRNVQLFGQTKERAQTDALTGLPNRGSFQTMVRQEFARAKRHGRPLSLLMVDLDFLKNINDRFGHPMGDMAIREVAERIMRVSRNSDYLAARYGGEEFSVILPETDFEGAVQAGQRICDAISETPLPTVGRITASVGVATYPLNAISKDELIQASDEALYKAKRGGRNQVATSDLVLSHRPAPVSQT